MHLRYINQTTKQKWQWQSPSLLFASERQASAFRSKGRLSRWYRWGRRAPRPQRALPRQAKWPGPSILRAGRLFGIPVPPSPEHPPRKKMRIAKWRVAQFFFVAHAPGAPRPPHARHRTAMRAVPECASPAVRLAGSWQDPALRLCEPQSLVLRFHA